MAQLDIEQKRGNSMWWLWLLIAALVVIAIWWFFWGSSGRGMGEMIEDSGGAVGEVIDTTGAGAALAAATSSPSAVDVFMDFDHDGRSGVMTMDNVNTATGLRDMAAAAEALAAPASAPAVVVARADSLRGFADELQRTSEASRQADITRRAFVMGANVLRDVKAGAADVDAVQQAAEAIAPATPLLDQRDAVQHYWDVSATAVQAHARRG